MNRMVMVMVAAIAVLSVFSGIGPVSMKVLSNRVLIHSPLFFRSNIEKTTRRGKAFQGGSVAVRLFRVQGYNPLGELSPLPLFV